MLILYSKIIGLNVMDLRSRTRLGQIDEIVLNNENLKTAGFILKKRDIWNKETLVVGETDIVEITNQGLVVSNENSVANLDESIRIKRLFEDNYFGVGQKVITKSGKYIGKVHDFLIDNKTFEIEKIYIKNMLKEKIISRDCIDSYIKNIIIIKDDRESIKVTSTVAETSTI